MGVGNRSSLAAVDVRSVITSHNYGQIRSWGMLGMHLAKKFDVQGGTFSRMPRSVVGRVVGGAHPVCQGLLDVTLGLAVVAAALELWKEPVDGDGGIGGEVRVRALDIVLYRLMRLLWVPRLVPYSIEYFSPMMNMVTRVSTLKLMGVGKIVQCTCTMIIVVHVSVI